MKAKIIFTIIIAVGIAIAFILAITTSGAVVEDGILKVKGMYGVKIPLSEIESVEKIDALPARGRRTNGLAAFGMKIGHFSYEKLGKVRLCILSADKPYLLITAKDEKIILGLGNEKNEAIYNQIKK